MRSSPPGLPSKHYADPHRVGASLLLAVYLVTALVAYGASRKPARLGMTVEPCAAGLCVAWVMPAGQAWYDGARPGMQVVGGADDWHTAAGEPAWPTRAVVRTQDGDLIELSVVSNPDRTLWRSLWFLGGVFAVLGALVLLRRGDLAEARWFAGFSAACSVGLAAGPAAGGPHAAWALSTVFVSLIAVGATVIGFASTLFETSHALRPLRLAACGVGALIVAGYLPAVLFNAPPYEAIRTSSTIFHAVTLLGAVAIIGVRAVRADSPRTRTQARICATGIAIGALPFVALALIPVTIGKPSPVPLELSVLLVGVMPAAFALSIARFEMLGIRTLIHRGLIYGGTTLGVLAIVTGLVVVLGPRVGQQPLAIASLVVAGVMCFFPLRWAMCRLTDRIVYGAEVDSAELIGAVHGDIVAAEENQQAARVLMQRIARALELEAAVLFLGDGADTISPVVAVGDHPDRVLRDFQPPHRDALAGSTAIEPLEIRWQSNTLLVSALLLSGRSLGYVVWGPKAQGETFTRKEKRLIATMTPILTLVVQEKALSEQRSDLNERLLRATETERARLAADLHDGPLQKAILLNGRIDAATASPEAIAQDLVRELREVCTRLRPAILDDLGLISALDWLVHEVPRRSTLRSELRIHGFDEGDRFAQDAELALFRITQEAINNAIKHSGATRIGVDLSRHNGYLQLDVQDDGAGFVVPVRSTGLGLAGMRERVRHLHGDISIRSAPTQGTTVTVKVPIDAEEQPR